MEAVTSGEQTRAPVFAIWYCTNRCNLRCPHCFVSVVSDCERGTELSTKDGIALIEDLARSDVYQLGFAGGEPFVRSDILELAGHARSLGLTVQLATNGLLVDATRVREMIGAGFQCIQISLDGLSEETHEHLRGRGTFTRAFHAVRTATEVGLPVVLALTVHKRNWDELPRLAEFAEQEGIVIVKLQPVWTPFCYADGIPGHLSRSEVAGALALTQSLFIGSHVELTTTRTARLFGEYGRIPRICRDDFDLVTIHPDGSVSPCEQDDGPAAGNALRDGFLPAWTASVRSTLARGYCGCHADLNAGGTP